MREVVFLKQNSERWKLVEHALQFPKQTNPDELAELYLQLTDDLSYARTFFPNSKTTAYLNALSLRMHQLIYRNQKEEGSRIIRFWKEEFPDMFGQYLPQLGYSFLIFLVAVGIGALSAAHDDAFVRLILGDAYVNMTLENIDKGDPMGVYKQAGAISMFLGITVNNIRVALFAFGAGLLLSFGTGLVLFQNGVMLGSFQYFFFQHDLGWESVRTIWIHGTIEISVIIIAGCAGLVMGNSVLFPGTYSRKESFKRGAKDGLKIVLSTVPFFIIAGFLEGFVTRHTEMPDFLSVLVIGLSLAFILGYYVYYPLKRKGIASFDKK